MTVEEGYYIICQPTYLITQFKNIQDFKEWADKGSVKDLEEAIKVFEENELYEHCAVMRDLVLTKNDV